MAIPDSGAIDAALVALLTNDATLAALLPDGVFFDAAPPGLRRFVLLAIQDSRDLATYDDDGGIDEVLYSVKGMALSTTNTNMRAVAARLDQLLRRAPAIAPVPETYRHLSAHRDEEFGRIRDVEIDALDPTIRWLHRGAFYRLVATI